MTNRELEIKLTTIYQTLFDLDMEENDERNKNWLNCFKPFTGAIPGKVFPFFLLVEEVDDSVEFIINTRSADLFRAKRDELNNAADFIPQIKVKDNWESYEFDISTLLLTEYVDWLWQQAVDKLEMQIWGYGLYVPIKEHWNQFLNPFSYPNKLWIGKEMDSIILIQNESNLLKCLARDKATLDAAQKILES